MISQQESQAASWGMSIGDAAPSVCGATEHDLTNRTFWNGRRPACALLGSLRGESPTAESSDLVDSRGTGWLFPMDARVDLHQGCQGSARFPAPLAWGLLDLETQEPWSWQPRPESDRSVTLLPGIALGLIAHRLLREQNARPSDPVALVVPNTLDIDEQDALLRGFRRAGINEPCLIWRPVAAALAWLDRFKDTVKPIVRSAENQPPTVWTIHLGLSAFEVCCLELIEGPFGDKRQQILPARRLPRFESLRARGLRLIEAASAATLESQQLLSESMLWRRLWCTDWMSKLLRCGTDSTLFDGHHDQIPEYIAASRLREMLEQELDERSVGNSELARTLEPIAAMESPSKPLSRPDLWHSGNPCRIGSWFDQIIAAVDHPTEYGSAPDLERAAGIVVTGELASVRVADRSFAEHVIERLFGSVALPNTMIEHASSTEPNLLAHGALIFAAKRSIGEPTYLDTLPMLESLVIRNGEPQWEDLLPSQDRYVQGGEEWSWRDEQSGYAIAAGVSELKLSVWREGHPTTKFASLSFGSEATEPTPVSLSIKMTPGQGNPRVEVKSMNPNFLVGKRVVLDWRKAKDTEKTKIEELADVPRTNPPLEPRLASRICWTGGVYSYDLYGEYTYDGVRKVLTPLTGRMGSASPSQLKTLRERLRERDNEFVKSHNPPDHGTAVSSDGVVDSADDEDQQLLNDFIIEADHSLAKKEIQDELLRILGYCSAPEHIAPNLFALIRTRLAKAEKTANPQWEIKAPMLTAIGSCLRDPADIALFCHVAAHHLARGNATNNWMRALARILQYRADALQSTDSALAEELMGHCYAQLVLQLEQYRAKVIYRHASLCIVYLLRRRRYDDWFINPESELAMQVKQTFCRAILLFKAGKIRELRGFVDLEAVTQMMIDYIDRRGRGRLVGMSIGD